MFNPQSWVSELLVDEIASLISTLVYPSALVCFIYASMLSEIDDTC